MEKHLIENIKVCIGVIWTIWRLHQQFSHLTEVSQIMSWADQIIYDAYATQRHVLGPKIWECNDRAYRASTTVYCLDIAKEKKAKNLSSTYVLCSVEHYKCSLHRPELFYVLKASVFCFLLMHKIIPEHYILLSVFQGPQEHFLYWSPHVNWILSVKHARFFIREDNGASY